MKKDLQNKIICYLILIFICVSFIRTGIDGDAFFDLNVGKSIFKYGIDFKDHFSFIPNLTFMYPHWLYDILLYSIFKFTNFTGLFIGCLFLYIIISIIYFNQINNKVNNKLYSLIVSILICYTLEHDYVLRVQSISYILLFLEVIFLNKFYANGNKKYALFVILDLILIVNMHMPLWLFTIVLSLPFYAEFLIAYILKKSNKLKNIISNNIIYTYPKNKLLFIKLFPCMLLTGLISPLKFYPYIYFFKAFGNKSTSFIIEMKKTVIIDHKLEIFIILLFLIYPFFNKCKLKIRDIFMFIGLLILSFIAKKYCTYFLIIASPIVFINYGKFFNFKIKSIKKLNMNIIRYTVIFSLIGSIIVNFMSIDLKVYQDEDSEYYPTLAANYILKNINNNNLRLYSNYDISSYIGYKGIKVFVDSRAEVFMPEFNGGHDILDDYVLSEKVSMYKEIVKKYQFTHMLISKGTDLYMALLDNKNFEIIYEDTKYVIFKNKVNYGDLR